MMAKWFLKTIHGEIDVSHLTDEQIVQVQTDLAMLRYHTAETEKLMRQHLRTPLMKRNRKGVK